jgi:prefoldin alpha subunit
VYSDSTEALQTIKPENKGETSIKTLTTKGKELFVPVTSSLYVKGNLSNVEQVLVDIGGGYYVQKSTPHAIEYTERKAKEIDDKLAQIQKAMESKRNSVVQVQMVFQAKLMSQ